MPVRLVGQSVQQGSIRLPKGAQFDRMAEGRFVYHVVGTDRWITVQPHPVALKTWIVREFTGGCDC